MKHPAPGPEPADPPRATKQPIVGQGTQEAPWRYMNGPRNCQPRECTDSQHNPVRNLWFLPQMPTIKRCQWCSSERPTAITLRLNQHKADVKAKKIAVATAKIRTVQVNKGDWESFCYFREFLKKCTSEAQRLSGERVTHDFGVYGKIKATEREIRLAELEIATLKSAPMPMAFLSLATGLSMTDIEALRAGAGANPDYPQIQAACQLKETRGELLAIIKDWQEVLADPDMPLSDKSKAYKEIVAKHSQILDLLPKPKKKEALDLLDRDHTPAEDLAITSVARFLLVEPATEEREGGPGPLR